FIAGPFLAAGKADAQTIPVPNPEEARRAVDSVKADGFDFVKILSNVPRESYFAIADEATKQNITFAGHVPYSISAEEAANAGQRSIEHLTGILLACSTQEEEIRKAELEALAARNYPAFTKLGSAILGSYSADKAKALFSDFTEHSTWQDPTLVRTMANSTPTIPNCSMIRGSNMCQRRSAKVGIRRSRSPPPDRLLWLRPKPSAISSWCTICTSTVCSSWREVIVLIHLCFPASVFTMN